jgi:transcriptional regulator with XRE-family HTH domain
MAIQRWLGGTRAAVAQALGVNPNLWGRYVSGETSPYADTVLGWLGELQLEYVRGHGWSIRPPLREPLHDLKLWPSPILALDVTLRPVRQDGTQKTHAEIARELGADPSQWSEWRLLGRMPTIRRVEALQRPRGVRLVVCAGGWAVVTP